MKGTIFGICLFMLILLHLEVRGQSDFHVYSRDSLDRAVWISRTKKSNFIVTGTSDSFGHKEDGIIMKYDDAFNLIWEKVYGGPKLDFLWGVAETEDGGYMVTGFTSSFGKGGLDCWVLRLTQKGDTVWTRTFGGPKDERAILITRTFDGNFAIVGQTESWGEGTDVLLFKISDRGEILWHKTFGGVKMDRGFNVLEASNHDLIISGITENDDIDALLIRTNSNGEMLWRKTYGGQGTDVPHYLLLRENQNILMPGYRQYQKNLHEPMLLEVDAKGNLLKQASFKFDGDARIMSGYLDSNGDFFGAGYCRKNENSDWDFYLIKTDKLCQLIKFDTYGEGKDDQGYSICPFKKGSSIAVGHSYSTTNGKGDLVFYVWTPK